MCCLPSAHRLARPAQDEMGEHAVTAVVATWPGEDGTPEVHFEVSAGCAPARRSHAHGGVSALQTRAKLQVEVGREPCWRGTAPSQHPPSCVGCMAPDANRRVAMLRLY